MITLSVKPDQKLHPIAQRFSYLALWRLKRSMNKQKGDTAGCSLVESGRVSRRFLQVGDPEKTMRGTSSK